MDNILDGSKLQYHPAEVAKFMDKGRLCAPITIDMALTQACQYQCKFCYAKLQKNKPHKMEWAHLKRLLKDASRMGVKSIALQGDGESTLHPNFPDFVELAHNLGLHIGLATNGHALTKPLIDRLLPAFNWIQFNMGAGSPEEYGDIMGVPEHYFHQVAHNARHAATLLKSLRKRQDAPGTTLHTQLVLRPQDSHLVLPYVKTARALGVDYARIKHCSDDKKASMGLGIDYTLYNDALKQQLKEAEALSTKTFKVAIKWSKMADGNKRTYDRCVGCQFMLQISGSGLVAPCGMLFAERYQDYWLGNITETPLREIIGGKKWRHVMDLLDSPSFDPKKMCGELCVQHDANKYIHALRHPPANWPFA